MQLWPHVRDYLNLHPPTVNVAIKVEDVCLQQRIAQTRGWRASKIGDTWQPFTRPIDANPHRVHAVLGMDQLAQARIGGRVAELPAILLALDNRAISNPYLPQNLRRQFRLTRTLCLADRC